MTLPNKETIRRIRIPPDAGSLKIPVLYHYQPFIEDRFRSIVESDLIYFSNPKDFNDPWDCRPWFRVPSNETEQTELLRKLQEAHQKHFPNHSRKERRRAAASLRNDADTFREYIEQISREIWDAIQKQYRVYCASTRSDCPLMWGHYADHHRGICLGFDCSDPVFQSAMQVQYSSEYPVYELFGENELAPFISKSEHWSYEGEFRIVSEEKAFAHSRYTHHTVNGLLKIAPTALRRVLIGARMPSDQKKRVVEIVRAAKPKTELVSAALCNDRYELKFQVI